MSNRLLDHCDRCGIESRRVNAIVPSEGWTGVGAYSKENKLQWHVCPKCRPELLAFFAATLPDKDRTVGDL